MKITKAENVGNPYYLFYRRLSDQRLAIIAKKRSILVNLFRTHAKPDGTIATNVNPSNMANGYLNKAEQIMVLVLMSLAWHYIMSNGDSER